MSNTTTNADPLAEVSSLYGPGTLLGWVCTFISVVVNWNFNQYVREADTLTNDFLAMLAIPTIAAGHVFYLVLQNKAANAQLEPFDPAIARRVAAVAAPLRTCMGFMAVIRCLEVMAAQKRQTKRLICCLFAGLVVTVGQIPVLICPRWPHEDWVPPSLFPFPSGFITGAGFGIGVYQICLILPHWHPPALGCSDVGQLGLVQTTAGGEPRPGFACAQHWRKKKRCEYCQNCCEEAEAVRWAHQEARWSFLATLALVSPIYLLVCFGVLWFVTGGGFNPTPESPNSILDLDQTAALLVGLVTVWCTLREAIRSRQASRGSMGEIKPRVEVAKDILKMYSAGEVVTLVNHMPLPRPAGILSVRKAWFQRTVHGI